jgi:hypothetical protein
MKKSSNIKSIHVNEEISKKAAAVDLELKDIDLKEIIRMGLSLCKWWHLK